MEYSVEKIPTWSLGYLINGDQTGLNEEEVQMIDNWVRSWGVENVVPIEDEDGIENTEYFSYYPLFGLATDVQDCRIYTTQEISL